jgi:hypothetical protein
MNESETVILNEIQLILAEKRTSLATMRTGITVFVLPLSVLSVLIATSRYYDIVHVKFLFIPLMILNGVLILLGGYLIVRSVIRIHRHDQVIKRLTSKNTQFANIFD